MIRASRLTSLASFCSSQGDGGVYFSTLGPASYDLGSEQYEDNIITDCFGKERLEEYRGKHKLDVLLVYAVNAKVVEQAPGGRSNAKMVSKSLFEDFATTALEDGSCKIAAPSPFPCSFIPSAFFCLG